MDSIEELRARLRDFAVRRDWGAFHTPKNLAMAVAGEAGELVAEFQWLTAEESRAVMADPAAGAAVRGELADVLLYLVQLADALDVDLLAAARDKIAVNENRFPPSHPGRPAGPGTGPRHPTGPVHAPRD